MSIPNIPVTEEGASGLTSSTVFTEIQRNVTFPNKHATERKKPRR